jgi:hypothetical protein
VRERTAAFRTAPVIRVRRCYPAVRFYVALPAERDGEELLRAAGPIE